MGNKKTLKVFSTASVAGMIATAVLSSQAFAAVDAYSVKVGEDVFQYSKQEIAKSFIEAKRGNEAALYNDFNAKLEKAGGFFAFHDDKTGYVDFDSIKGKFVEAKRAGAEFKVDEFTESSDAKVVEVPTVKKAVVSEDGKVEYTDEDNSGEEAGIKAVTSLNMKQIKVEFTSKITDSQKKDDVESVDNYELRNSDGDKIEESFKGTNVAFEKAELDESGKFVVLTISDAVMANQQIEVDGTDKSIDNDDDDNYVNNQSKYTLVIDENITDKDEVEKEFELNDRDLPEVVSAEVVGKDTIKVKFSEPIAPEKVTTNGEGHERVALLNDDTFEINDDDVSVDEVRLCDNHNEANIILASDLEDGEKVKVDVKSKAKDYAGYALKKDELNIESKENKEKLQIVGYKESDNKKITLVFNKDIKFGDDADDDYSVENNSDMDDDFMKNFYHTNTKNAAKTATVDGNELKLTFENKLSGTVYVYVDADSVQDLWEVKNDDLFVKADINLDNTRPEVKHVEQGDTDKEIEVKFSEAVKEKDDYSDSDDRDAAGDEKDNYTVEDKDGKDVKISSIKLKDEGKKAVITLRDSLDAGDEYTVKVKDVEDEADNRIKDTSVKFEANGAAVEQGDISVSAYNRGKNDQKIVVDFDAKMKTGDAADSIENLNNYTIEIYNDSDKLLDKINASDYYKAKAKAIADDNKVEITLPGDKWDDEDQYSFGDDDDDDVSIKSNRFTGKGTKVKVVIGRVSDSEDNHSDDVAYAPIDVNFGDSVLLNDDDDNLIATSPEEIKVTWGDELSYDKDDVSLVVLGADNKPVNIGTEDKPNFLELRATSKIDKKNGVTTVTYTLDDNYKGGDKNYIKGNNELNYDGTITLSKEMKSGSTTDTTGYYKKDVNGVNYKVAIKTADKTKSDNEYDATLVPGEIFVVDDNIAPDIAKLGDMIGNNDAYDDRSDYDDDIKVIDFNKVTKEATVQLTFEEAINPASLSSKSFETSDDDIDVTKVYMKGDVRELGSTFDGLTETEKRTVYVKLNFSGFTVEDTDDVNSVLEGVGIKSVNSISDIAEANNYNNGKHDDTDYNYNNELDLEIPEVSSKDLAEAEIAGLPAVADLKLEDKAAVTDARKHYDALTAEQKKSVSDTDITNAEAQIKVLEKAVEDHKEALVAAKKEADKITTLTVAGGTVTLPTVAAEYDVAIASSSDEKVIDKDGTVTATAKEEKVNVTLTLTLKADKTVTADTKEIEVTVAAKDVAIKTAAIAGVTAPVKEVAPTTTIAETDEYEAVINWAPTIAEGAKFAADTAYTATITITPKKGYTLTGVTKNFFTVAGAKTVTNDVNAGVVTVVFEKTAL